MATTSFTSITSQNSASLSTLPSDCIGQILSFLENPSTTSRVCKSWRTAGEGFYQQVFNAYRRDPKISLYMPIGAATATAAQQVQLVHQTYARVMGRGNAPHIQPLLANLTRETPLLASSLNRVLKTVEDANLVQFFIRLSQQIQNNEQPELGGLSVKGQAASIRVWMGDHQTFLDTITRLDLDGLKLTTLPPEIGQFTNLEQFSIRNNEVLNIGKLTDLPSEIWKLKNLQTLDLAGNNLTALPREIGLLTKLKSLFLHGNSLTTLPKEIGQLPNLQWLSLSDRQQTSLPPEIEQMTQLSIAYLQDTYTPL